MEDNLQKELKENFNDFMNSAEEDLKKGRFNPAVSSYFKGIAILCDLNIYKKVGLLPKNHSERFLYLKMYIIPLILYLRIILIAIIKGYQKKMLLN